MTDSGRDMTLAPARQAEEQGVFEHGQRNHPRRAMGAAVYPSPEASTPRVSRESWQRAGAMNSTLTTVVQFKLAELAKCLAESPPFSLGLLSNPFVVVVKRGQGLMRMKSIATEADEIRAVLGTLPRARPPPPLWAQQL